MEEGRKPDQRLDVESNVQEQLLKNSQSWKSLCLLIYQSIGVVYGGLGTSPLYVFPNIFAAPPSELQVLGAMSLIFWTLTIIVVFKYVCLVLHANDRGEGGTFAMYVLLCRHARISAVAPELGGLERHAPSPGACLGDDGERGAGSKCALERVQRSWLGRLLEASPRAQAALLGVVLLGTAFMFCDGVLSPAVSVISALAGMQVASPHLSKDVVAGASCAVLLALFLVQRLGTSRLGNAFSPVLIVWFLFFGATGAYNTVGHMPSVFKAISPHYAVRFFIGDARGAWVSLGGVILCISGSEAIYADMGHFSHRAITVGTLAFVYPALLLIYFGEAAYLARFPQHYAQAFYRAVPERLFWPAFVIATASALVGSQSLITSTFSVVRLSARLACFPPVKVTHTGKQVEGQIYLPGVNWTLCALGLGVLAGFRDTTAVGYAFSVVVVCVMLITTVLVTVVTLVVWGWHLAPVLAASAALFCMEGVYLAAVLYEVPGGGWFALVVAGGVLAAAALWRWGTALSQRHAAERSQQLVEDLLLLPAGTDSDLDGEGSSGEGGCHHPGGLPVRWAYEGRSLSRVPGLAVYLADSVSGLPAGFVAMVRAVGIVHDAVVLLAVHQVLLPSWPPEQRFEVAALGIPGCYRVVCRLGYADALDRNAAFLDALLQALLQEARFRALSAKWSAADIHSGSPRERAAGALPMAAGSVLGQSPSHSRSMRRISLDVQADLQQRRPPSCLPEPLLSEERPPGSGVCRGGGTLQQTEQCMQLDTDDAQQGVPCTSPGAEPLGGELVDKSETGTVRGAWRGGMLRDGELQTGVPEPGSQECTTQHETAAPSERLPQEPPHDTCSTCGDLPEGAPAGAEPSGGGASHGRGVPQGSGRTSGASMRRRAAASGQAEAQRLLAARAHGVTFVIGRCALRARAGSGWARRLLLERGYGALQALSYQPDALWRNVHPEGVLEVQVSCRV